MMNANKNNSVNLDDPKLKEVTAFAQIIPSEMMDAIKKAAAAKDISIDMEISSRLLATFVEPVAFGTQSQLPQMLNQKFSSSQLKAESEMRREGWLYIYEIDKLKILLAMKGKLPRKFKEAFSLIDVAKETARILAEADQDGEKE